MIIDFGVIGPGGKIRMRRCRVCGRVCRVRTGAKGFLRKFKCVNCISHHNLRSYEHIVFCDEERKEGGSDLC